MVPDVAANVTQIQKAQPKAPSSVRLGQAFMEVRDDLILGAALGAVVKAGSLTPNVRQASAMPTPLCRHRSHGQLAALGGPYIFSKCFFQQVGLHAQIRKHALQPPILVFQCRSRFSRTNGVHRSLRLIMDASMPPYFARHL